MAISGKSFVPRCWFAHRSVMDIQALHRVYMLTFVHNADNNDDDNADADNHTLKGDWCLPKHRCFSSNMNNKCSFIIFCRFFIFWNGQCSGWIIAIMSVERFFAIFLPIQTKYWTSRGRIATIFLIIASLLATLDLHFFWTYKLFEKPHVSYCSSISKYRTFLTVYWPWINLAIYSVVPFTILISCSTAIILRILYSNYVRKRNMNQKEGVKLTSITMTLLCVSFMFVLTTGPVAIYRGVYQTYFQMKKICMLAIGRLQQTHQLQSSKPNDRIF